MFLILALGLRRSTFLCFLAEPDSRGGLLSVSSGSKLGSCRCTTSRLSRVSVVIEMIQGDMDMSVWPTRSRARIDL